MLFTTNGKLTSVNDLIQGNYIMQFKPLLIAVEGMDGVGKTTITNRIWQYIHDEYMACKKTSQNRDTMIGLSIRKMLENNILTTGNDDTRAMLMCAGINDLVNQYILPSLEDGCSVVMDRYTFSARVYQAESTVVKPLCNMIEQVILPDLVILLDAPANVARDRVFQRAVSAENANGDPLDELELASPEEYKKRRTTYLELAEEYADIFEIFNVNKPLDEVWLQIKPYIDELFQI